MRIFRLAFGLFVFLLLLSCARQSPLTTAPLPMTPTAGMPEEFPASRYQQAAAAGKPVLHVVSARSLITVIVRRGGRLARLGHDHVVASHDIAGFIALDSRQADLYVPLATLSIDEAQLRVAAKLDTQPSAADIAGTRQNMLEKVLEAARFPFARLRVTANAWQPPSAQLEVVLTLHGVTRTLSVPAQIALHDGELEASGEFSIKQTDFGITPFSVLGGALAVEDDLILRFDLVAVRLRHD